MNQGGVNLCSVNQLKHAAGSTEKETLCEQALCPLLGHCCAMVDVQSVCGE